jgi:chemotaxis protein MotB
MFDSELPDWFLTYGDLMSLLLCFFVMLYAVSAFQASDRATALESFRGGFGAQGISKQTGQPLAVPKGGKSKTSIITVEEQSVQGGIVVFQSGSGELTEEAKQTLNALTDTLSQSPFMIQITAYAGSGERGVYRDSMDLSYCRAVNVWRFLVSRGINRNCLRLCCVGDSEPAAKTAGPTSPPTDTQAATQLPNARAELQFITNTPRKNNENHEKLLYLNL